MTGVRIETSIETGPVADALGRVAAVVSEPAGVLGAIGTGLVETTQTRFEQGVDPQGNAWPALSSGYAADKRGPGVLRESGMRGGLMGSITREVTGDAVQVGTNKVYAAVHQSGAEIRPKSGDRLLFQIGGQTVAAKSVTIPARPFLGIGPADELMIGDVVEGALDKGLGAA